MYIEVFLDEDMSTEIEAIEGELLEVPSSRYLSPRVQVPRAPHRIHWLLFELDDDRFKQELRMSRDSFEQLAEMLKSDAVFQTPPRRMQQAPVRHQLAVALTRFGHFGNAASVGKTARTFSISVAFPLNFF